MILKSSEPVPTAPAGADAAQVQARRGLPLMQPAIDDHVFLVGRPPIAELLGFVRNMVLDGQRRSQAELTQVWRDANDHVHHLEQAEPGVADGPPIAPLPTELLPLAAQVRADPMFQSAFGLVPTDFAIVELDRLVVFQKFINLRFVETLKGFLPGAPSAEDIANLAFGLSRPAAPVKVLQNAPNTFTIISPSNDLRFLEGSIVQPDAAPGLPSSGRPVARIVLNVGFGSNYLNAIHVNNRLVLNNGSHRAYALRSLGITHAPCLVQRVTRPEELPLIASGDLAQQPQNYLAVPRPPMLKDYFDARLRLVLPVPSKNRMVRVQFGAEQSDVPAT